MPEYFELNGQYGEIPQDSVDAFIKANPKAKKVRPFKVGEKTGYIPIEQVDQFRKTYPKAQPLYEEKMSFGEGLLRSLAPERETFVRGQSNIPGAQGQMMTEVAGNLYGTLSRLLYSGIKSATSNESMGEALSKKTELGRVVLGDNANPLATLGLDIVGDPLNYIGGAFLKMQKIRNAAKKSVNPKTAERIVRSIEDLSKTDPQTLHKIREDDLIKAFNSKESVKQQEAIEFVEGLKKQKLSRRADISTTVRGQGKLEVPQIDKSKLKSSKEVVLEKYGPTSEIKKIGSSEQINWANTKTGKEYARGVFKAIKEDIADTSMGIVANPYKNLEKFIRESKLNLTASERQYLINSTRKIMSSKLATMEEKEQRVMSVINDISQGKLKKIPQPMGELPSTTLGYNTEKMHPRLKETLPNVIEDFRKDFDDMRGRRLTTRQAVNTAIKKANTLRDEDLLSLKRGDVKNATDNLAARVYANNRLLEAADKMEKLGSSASKIQINDVTEESKNVLEMFMKTRALGTETGRTLKYMSIPIDDGVLNGLKQYQKSLAKIDPKSAEKLKNILMDADELPQMKDKVLFWWYNSMLSNPFTDLANITGNTSHFMWEALTTGLRHPLSIGDVGKGLYRGWKSGIADAKKIYTQESAIMSKFAGGADVKRYDVYPKSKLGKFFRGMLPTTRLSMEDAVYSGMAREMRLSLGAKQIARAEKANVDDVYNTVKKIMDDPELAVESRAYQDLANYAEKYAEFVTFRTPLKSAFGKGIQNTLWVKPFIPFMRVLANISKVGYKNSPVGFAKLFGKEFKTLSKFERQDVVRRALAGTALYTGVGTLMANGEIEITGQGPENRRQRELWDKMGYKPNHIYWKNKNGTRTGISYQNINPFNVVLAVLGNWQDQYRFGNELTADDKDFIDKLSYALGGAAATMTDQSFMQGVKQLFDWIKYKDSTYLKDFVTRPFIPNIVGFPRNIKEYAQGSKPRYEAQEWWDRLKRRVGLYEGLTPTYSAYGRQKESGYERFPFFPSTTKKSPILEVMNQKKLSISVPSKRTKIGDRLINEQEYAQYINESGKSIMAILSKNIDRIRRMNSEQAQDFINDIVRRERANAKRKLKGDNTESLKQLLENF